MPIDLQRPGDVLLAPYSMRTDAPTYRNFIGIPMGAMIYWGFCENGYLVDVRVIKDIRLF